VIPTDEEEARIASYPDSRIETTLPGQRTTLRHWGGRRWERIVLALNLGSVRSSYPNVIAYVLPALLASLAVQTWFKPGTVIANGDIGPPLVLGRSYLSHWNQLTDGVGGPSYDIIMLPLSEFLRAARALGFDSSMSQRIWLTLLIAGSAVAVVFFARSLALSPLAAGLAGLFAMFNAYRFVSPFDPVPLATLILCGLLGGLVVRAGLRRDARSGVLAFALISSASGFVFVNPPHFVLLGGWIAVSTVLVWARGGLTSLRSALSFLLRASPLVVLVNSWWIVPAAMTVLNPSFSERFAAPGPFAWAWTDRRATILNAFTLNTTWGWNEPMYYPYATRLDRLPFAPLRYAFPFLAFLGLVVSKRRERRLAVVLVAVGFVTVLVVKGLHPPLVAVNRSFYVHVPGSWLFRDPSKVLLFLMFAYAILAGIGVANLSAMKGRFRIPATAGATTLAIAAIAYAYPLFTGAVIPDRRPVLPPAHVRVPGAWTEAAGFLNALPDEGKMLVLPNADFYALPTTWGYYGVPFTHWAIQRPVLEPLPGGGFNLPGTAGELVESIQQDLLAGRSKESLPAFRALGVRYVLLRRDLDTSFPGRRLANPAMLARGLVKVPGIHLLRSFGLLDVYALEGDQSPEVFSAAPRAAGAQSGLIPQALTVLPQNESLITPASFPPSISPNSQWSPGGRTEILRIQKEALWKVEAAESSAGLSVRFSDPITTSLAQRKVEAAPARVLTLPHIATPALITLNNSTFVFERGERRVRLGYATLPENVEIGLWGLRRVVPIDVSSNGSVGNCDSHGKRTPEESGLSTSILELDGIPTLRLMARDSTACVAFPVRPFDPGARYRVQFDYRGVSGSPPRVCLWQEVAERCAALPPLDKSPGWHHFDAPATLSSKTQALRLFFYASDTGDSKTRTEYRQPRIEIFGRNSTQRLQLDPSSKLGMVDLPPGWLRLTTRSPLASPQPIDIFSHLPVGDCNRYDGRTPQEVGLAASTMELDGIPTLQLSARDHAACVSFPVEPFEPAARYRVRFDYRGLSGSPPRVCLWQQVAARCAALPELDPSPGWHRFDAIAELDPRAKGLQLFFYSDGMGNSTTTTQYREVGVNVDETEDLLLVQDSRPTNLPTVESQKLSPAEFRVSVSRADNPYLLVLTESYATGWRVQIEGQYVTVPHVMVDGYANGWILDRRGTYEIRLVFEPEQFARIARWISLVSLSVFGVYGFAARFGKRRRTMGRHVPRTAAEQDGGARS
jgi:arabinofuranan 3-O-arabinosyltransferase